jgi:uncharacterized protein YjaG (DUF416 family)
MESIESLYEKKVDKLLSKMFGESPSELKAITKMSLMSNVLTDEMKQTLKNLREQQLKEAEMINAEMELTRDASGNEVLIPKENSAITTIYHDN